MNERVNRMGSELEGKPQFRADVDHKGTWYVWRRLSTNGWATMRRCVSEVEAAGIAKDLNTRSQTGVA